VALSTVVVLAAVSILSWLLHAGIEALRGRRDDRERPSRARTLSFY
jgi:hypothetical protein